MRTEVPLIEKNIVLVGFMGVGKTSIGQALAKKCTVILLILTPKSKQS